MANFSGHFYYDGALTLEVLQETSEELVGRKNTVNTKKVEMI